MLRNYYFPFPGKWLEKKRAFLTPLPFEGIDIWNGYEISWLNRKGKPEIAMAEFLFSCHCINIVESKSFKLYLNSFNQSFFDSLEEVNKILIKDLSLIAEGDVRVNLFRPDQLKFDHLEKFSGTCLDHYDIETTIYQVSPKFLEKSSDDIEESLYSNLLKSNCRATGQPDWGSVLIRYKGKKIDHEGLLKYIISYRNHLGFHEDCVEQIFHDILKQCQPDCLTVYARYTRRGGLDINPFRSNFEKVPENIRQFRQ